MVNFSPNQEAHADTPMVSMRQTRFLEHADFFFRVSASSDSGVVSASCLACE
jgi:hypothetical protein